MLASFMVSEAAFLRETLLSADLLSVLTACFQDRDRDRDREGGDRGRGDGGELELELKLDPAVVVGVQASIASLSAVGEERGANIMNDE